MGLLFALPRRESKMPSPLPTKAHRDTFRVASQGGSSCRAPGRRTTPLPLTNSVSVPRTDFPQELPAHPILSYRARFPFQSFFFPCTIGVVRLLRCAPRNLWRATADATVGSHLSPRLPTHSRRSFGTVGSHRYPATFSQSCGSYLSLLHSLRHLKVNVPTRLSGLLIPSLVGSSRTVGSVSHDTYRVYPGTEIRILQRSINGYYGTTGTALKPWSEAC